MAKKERNLQIERVFIQEAGFASDSRGFGSSGENQGMFHCHFFPVWCINGQDIIVPGVVVQGLCAHFYRGIFCSPLCITRWLCMGLFCMSGLWFLIP